MTSPSNKPFARSLVNRYWKHFFSRGIVEPEDDMRTTNPATNPELLDELAQHFVDQGFDLKDLVRTICRSKTYQLSSTPNEYNQSDKQNFSRYYPRRLPAESLHETFHRLTLAQRNLAGLPDDATAAQLPDPSTGPYFLKVFGMPEGDTACECERSDTANLAQSLHLLNSREVQQKIAFEKGRAARLASESDRDHKERVTEIYLSAFGRLPDDSEMNIALNHIQAQPDNLRSAYEDLIWAIVNTKEFLFNH